jgi:type I restriction enzyme M protein
MHANLIELEKKLWSAADELRANSELKSADYSVPVPGLIFLRYADVKFAHAHQELEGKGSAQL